MYDFTVIIDFILHQTGHQVAADKDSEFIHSPWYFSHKKIAEAQSIFLENLTQLVSKHLR